MLSGVVTPVLYTGRGRPRQGTCPGSPTLSPGVRHVSCPTSRPPFTPAFSTAASCARLQPDSASPQHIFDFLPWGFSAAAERAPVGSHSAILTHGRTWGCARVMAHGAVLGRRGRGPGRECSLSTSHVDSSRAFLHGPSRAPSQA